MKSSVKPFASFASNKKPAPKEEMRAAFAGVDPHGGHAEPSSRRALIGQLIRQHRKARSRP